MSCYLLLGEDGEAKQARIKDIRDSLAFSPDAEKFDYEVLYGHKLDPHDLSKALLALPAIAQQRLLLIREAHKLAASHQDILRKFLKEQRKDTVVILESCAWSARTAFVKALAGHARVEEFGRPGEINVFDMTRAMTRRRAPEALKILAGLLEDGVHPLQIMGGLVWFWGKTGERVPPVTFKKGLLALQEADLNIKRSRLRPEYTLETLVMKLYALMA